MLQRVFHITVTVAILVSASPSISSATHSGSTKVAGKDSTGKQQNWKTAGIQER